MLIVFLGVLPLIAGFVPSAKITPQSPQTVIEQGQLLQPTSGPVASPPKQIYYPAASINVQVHSLEPDSQAVASRSLVPPETTDGYWLASFGSPGAGSTNTTYIVGHTWVDQDAPFNHLSTKAAPGDRLTVVTATGKVEYKVDTVATQSKSTMKDSNIWSVVPNNLVLISCHINDPWGKNVVVVASPLAVTP
ncbi:class F sortase [Pseudarthrobacter sp. fls2-241-R2A-168]|uniref:class F sortase n=1 Tax=Pseudarthrobacter sp. fls2-241-R2A-168 TaxID=3040304 RepID=UPI0025575B14|nr:class F sortase [Pseudarthrobacter sp. fls2-241-R2A-168]